ncbi:MAG: recombinase family protein [Dermatophilaceae bacterium]|nr:recombinase family protein [Dermatophilaceae bacterium]
MGHRTGIYVRISDDREGRELGVTRQEEDTRALCDRDGDVVVDVYKDNDISASTRSRKERPGYKRMLEDARTGRITKIVAYTSGRLTRRPREHEDQIDLAVNHGTIFKYVASPSFDLNTAAGRRIARTLAANDAGEAEDISERIIRSQLQMAEAGLPRGGKRPYGYGPDGMAVREDEHEVIREAAGRVLAGESLRSICLSLDQRGIPTALKSGRWDPNSLRAILLRPRNVGLVVYQGEILGPAKWEPVFRPGEEEIWHAVCALLEDPSRSTTLSRERKHLGTSLYLCGVCDDGTPVRITNNKGETAYRCKNFGHLVRTAKPIDDFVERLAVARLRRADAVALLKPREAGVDLHALRTQATAIRVRLEELDDELDDGEITKANWTRRTERLKERLSKISDQLAVASPVNALADLAGDPAVAERWYGREEDRSDGLSVSRRDAAIRALMTVTLLPLGRVGRLPKGAPELRPGSVRIDWHESH